MKKVFVSIMVLAAVSVITGCFTKATAYTKTNPDGTKESCVSIIGTGDKVSQVAADGLFADGTAEDLGAGVKNASASQQSTGIEGTLNGLGQLMTGMATFMAASQGVKAPVSGAKVVSPVEETEAGSSALISTPETLPAESVAVNASTLAAKMAEAKATGKPLVVVAGNVGCGYCTKLDRLLDADSAFLARTDIVLYRETSPWATNQAGKWTGGGLFPVLRVTQWDSGGKVLCDKKVNRPQTVADIEAAVGSCAAGK